MSATKTVSLPTVLSSSTAAAVREEQKFNPRDFDLTYTIAQYLDRHMVLPLIEFLQEKRLYPDSDLWSAKLELVSKTKMVDFYIEEYTKYHGKEPAAAQLEFTPAVVNSQLKEWKEACAPLLDVLNDPDLVDAMRRDQKFTVEHLKVSHKVTEVMVDHLYRYAKLSFDCGRYRDAADFLYYFRVLSKDEEKKFWALWGKLAAEILMSNSDSALDDLHTLRDLIDQRKGDHVVQLQQRTWLIHWSLFAFFSSEAGHTNIIDFLFDDQRLLNAIQTTCPHILRYLTCAVIINKRRKTVLKELVRVLSQEKDTYTDPLCDFLRTLYVEFDFETAQKKLKQCEALLANDFFLGSISDELLESARQLVFETYARTHQAIDITLLAQRLDIKIAAGTATATAPAAAVAPTATATDSKSAAAANASAATVEQKIVELIRNARVDVKIDAKKNQIVMDSSRHPSIYQQLIDKTESLTQRTADLAAEIDKRIQQKMDAKNDRD